MDLKLQQALDNLPPLREIISQHQLSAQKALGQNFLLDQNITDKIVREAGDFEGCTIFEIGPGPGGLTRSLLKSAAKKVVAIEFDPRAVEALQNLVNVSNGKLTVMHGDALTAVLHEMGESPRGIVANLPYNIATPLLINWLKDISKNPQAYRFMALMFQKEVTERICAMPSTKAYGRLSVIAQWLCDVSVIYELPASAFTPPPKVKSAVVRFSPKENIILKPEFHDVERVTELAFGQRRKMIRSSLKFYMPIIEKLEIDPTIRAENLTVDEFLSIASDI
ncbi:MAG: 16S rRNA (adenine(1518)-N(6)/adenine(1519)-N(6))-dimethyltransferase RsmA [Pseudomonadota bacterium]